MVLCQVGNGALPIVKVKATNDRLYQLSYADLHDTGQDLKYNRRFPHSGSDMRTGRVYIFHRK